MIKEINQKIEKSKGVNESEQLLAEICDNVFLKLWSYPNVYKKPAKELCDVFIAFEDSIFIFSVKDIKFNTEKDIGVAWQRWKNKAVNESIEQLDMAEKHVRNNSDKVFIDAKCEVKFPIEIPDTELKIYKIIVAHGATEACKNNSSNKITGSLSICYEDTESINSPFSISLPRNNIYHLLDSHNLEIILGELDTITDLAMYFEAKEEAIKKYDVLSYCGEEDILANYYYNRDEINNKRYIGFRNTNKNFVHIDEGKWECLKNKQFYINAKKQNKNFIVWDNLLQYVSQEALNRNLLSGDFDNFNEAKAIIEMAKEPRFMRREISKRMLEIFNKFPKNDPGKGMANGFSSYYEGKYYVLLQFHPNSRKNIKFKNVDEYIKYKGKILKVACGITKIKYPEYKKIIGIAMDAPKYANGNSECYWLLDDSSWTEDFKNYCIESNKVYKLLAPNNMKTSVKIVSEFPESKLQKSKVVKKSKKKLVGTNHVRVGQEKNIKNAV